MYCLLYFNDVFLSNISCDRLKSINTYNTIIFSFKSVNTIEFIYNLNLSAFCECQLVKVDKDKTQGENI